MLILALGSRSAVEPFRTSDTTPARKVYMVFGPVGAGGRHYGQGRSEQSTGAVTRTWLECCEVPNRGGEPKPNAGAPPCPRWLCDKGKAVWRQLTPKLAAAGIRTVIDGARLARFCELFVHWREAAIQLRGEEHVIAQTNGVRCANPLFKTMVEFSRELARLEQAYGLTPADRAGMCVDSAGLIGEPEEEARFFRQAAG